jgi:hypothetical protein
LDDLDELNEPSFETVVNQTVQQQQQHAVLIGDDDDDDDNDDNDEWEDVLNMDAAEATSAVRGTSRMSIGTLTRTSARKSMAAATPRAGLGPRMSEEYYEGPSFTLQDMLLRAGREGVQGANGTFNFDLLRECPLPLALVSCFLSNWFIYFLLISRYQITTRWTTTAVMETMTAFTCEQSQTESCQELQERA